MTKTPKPVHPGEILQKEFMVPLGLSMNRVAMDLRVPVTRIADIATGELIFWPAGMVLLGISRLPRTWLYRVHLPLCPVLD
jgi:hypothetical protein